VEEALKKTGLELFKELLRIYPVAAVEDYHKLGQWKEDLVKTDLQLIDAHRREAGAPEPLSLDQIPEVKVPATVGMPGLMPGGALNMGGIRPAIPGVATAAAPGAAAGAAAAGPVAELRLIALFVAKWKLDPTKTKTVMAKLTPARRRYVIQNFKTATTGVAATTALEQYIAQCEKTNVWGAATATVTPAAGLAAAKPGMAAVRPAMAPAAMGGIKRPLTPPASMNDPNKRIRLATPGATPAGMPGQAPNALASRVAAAGMQRPGMSPPGIVKPAVPPVRMGVAPGNAGVRPQQAAGVRPGMPVRPGGPAMIRPASVGALRPGGPAMVRPGMQQPQKPPGLIKGLLQRI